MNRRAWIVLLALLLIPVAPGLADAKGGHGRGHGSESGHSYRGGHGRGGGHHYSGGHGYRGGHGYNGWYGPWWYAHWWYPASAYGYRYPYPSPYYQETRVIVEGTPVYVERPQSAAPPPAPPNEAYWHYCESLSGYYPDVASCPEDWIKVPPRPQ